MKTQFKKTGSQQGELHRRVQARGVWSCGVRAAGALPRLAAELGIRAPLLYRWAHLERESKASSSEPRSKRSLEALEAEIRRFRVENAKLLEQR